MAALLASAELIIESGVALTQEIHDGPFELFTGHGMWARHEGHGQPSAWATRHVVRIDLDPNLERAWADAARPGRRRPRPLTRGTPKATGLKMPFRMEMSGFARLPGALPLTGDLGVIWPLLASRAMPRPWV